MSNAVGTWGPAGYEAPRDLHLQLGLRGATGLELDPFRGGPGLSRGVAKGSPSPISCELEQPRPGLNKVGEAE